MILTVALLGAVLVGGRDAIASTAGEMTAYQGTSVRGNALLVPMEARRAALGEAFVAAGDDGSAAGNPASLAQVTRLGVFGSYHKVGDAYGATHDGLTVPLGPGTLAAGFSYFALGEADNRDAYGMRSGGTFYYDYALFLGWGMPNPKFMGIPGWIGVTVEAVREGVGGNGEAVTVGEVVPFGDKLKAGAMVEHLGSGVDGYSLPAAGRIGATYLIIPQVEGAADLRYGFTDHQMDVAAGVEAFPRESIQLRAGYRVQSPSLGAGGVAGLSAGVGARWKSLRLDYACQFYGDLGTGQFVTLAWGGRQ